MKGVSYILLSLGIIFFYKKLINKLIAFDPYPIFCTIECVAILTILAPASLGNYESWNCYLIFHGIKSPDGFNPLWLLYFILLSDILPYKATWIAQSTSGIYVLPYSFFFNGPTNTNTRCDGESDNNCKSFGLFL